MAKTTFETNYWVLVKPSVDLPGQWTAHCLDFDIVTQGESVEHAMAMIQEAVEICICDDLNAGCDPHDRGTTPEEDWAEWKAVLRRGKRLKFEELNDAAHAQRIACVVIQMHFVAAQHSSPVVDAQLSAWLINATNGFTASHHA